MTEVQSWVLIGVFATIMIGVLGIVTSRFDRVMKAEFAALRAEIRGEFKAIDAKFDAVDRRFEALEARIAHLDRDISAISRRMFGTDDRL